MRLNQNIILEIWWITNIFNLCVNLIADFTMNYYYYYLTNILLFTHHRYVFETHVRRWLPRDKKFDKYECVLKIDLSSCSLKLIEMANSCENVASGASEREEGKSPLVRPSFGRYCGANIFNMQSAGWRTWFILFSNRATTTLDLHPSRTW